MSTARNTKRETTAVRNARLKWTAYIHHFGRDHPRTVQADRELAEARARAAQDEADRLRALADAMPDPVAVAS